MTASRATKLSADAIKEIRATRERAERIFLAMALDYIRENAVAGDVHEYGCHLRPVLPLAIDVGKSYPVPGMKFFGFGSFQEPRVVPGRAARTETAMDMFVSLQDLEKVTDGQATLLTGPASTIMAKQERDRFMNTQNKVALAIIHAPTPVDAREALEFVEPLLTEGSVIYFADLISGYRRTPAKDAGRAFLEFQRNCRFQYVRFLDVGWWGKAYVACLPADLPLEKL
jgi:hypothetical protein